MSKKTDALLRKPYSRLIVADEETGRFSAQVVEFSGCFAEGDTAAEAAANLEEAAKAWLTAVIERGQAVPEPTGDNEYSGKFVVRLPRSLHKQCSLYARQEGVSLNQFVLGTLAQRAGATCMLQEMARRMAVVVDEIRKVVANRDTDDGRLSSAVGQGTLSRAHNDLHGMDIGLLH